MRWITPLYMACLLLAVIVTSVTASSQLPAPRNNVLLIIADDLGVDVLRCYAPDTLYGIHDLPPTPNIDALVWNGVLFSNARCNPVCSPTRAAIHTGRHPFRTGVLGIVPDPPADPELGLNLDEEMCLPKVLSSILHPRGGAIASAAFGKWHLNTGPVYDPPLLTTPNTTGYDHYSGSFFNFRGFETYFF